MQQRWSHPLWYLVVLTLPAIFLYIAFKDVFACPSCYLYSDAGDGLKNYFTLAYYVLHDEGWRFSGMNYPYGEHILYTDNQPVIAIVLRWIHDYVFKLDAHIIGIMNMLIILSAYLCMIILYVIQRRWNTGKVWALMTAIIITFLSPQLWRMQGHYALAYLHYLPLVILLLDLLVRSDKKWLWGFLLTAHMIIMSLTHLYFLLLGSIIICGFFAFWWWMHRKQTKFILRTGGWMIASVVVPVIFLFTLKNSTDHVEDRPVEPWGIDNHTIAFESTFFPLHGPFDKTWKEILYFEAPDFERRAYVGLIGLVLLPAVLFFLYKKQDEAGQGMVVKAFLGAGIISWLMGSGIIYQYGFRFVWDIVPLLKQFRGLGRFGIPFYYIYTLVCSYLLYRFYIHLRHRDLSLQSIYIAGIAISIWGFEAWYHTRSIATNMLRENVYMSDEKEAYMPLLESKGYSPSDFQAILQFPLVAIGGETVGVARGFWTLREGIHAAMETGLPLIDFAMSRTSQAQNADVVELISSPYTPKRRATLLDHRPLLLVCEEEFVTPNEIHWISLADSIGAHASITLYALDVNALKKIQDPVVDNTVSCTGQYNDFENNLHSIAMNGNGALPVHNAPQLLWSMTDTSVVAMSKVVSFWSYTDNHTSTMPVPRLKITASDGKIIQDTGVHRENIIWDEVSGQWWLVSIPFQTLGPGFTYELFIDNNGPVIDNLLVKNIEDTCIIRVDNGFLFNNLPVKQ